MIEFPSIKQFSDAIRYVRDQAQYIGRDKNGDPIYNRSIPFPTLKFRGTVKLHGTNAGIVYDYATGEITYQSRERKLTLTSDNTGFMRTQVNNEHLWRQYFEFHREDDIAKIAVFGVWCGRGIENGGAISDVGRMFVVFAVKYVFADGETTWGSIDPADDHIIDIPGVCEVEDFPTWEIDVDFNTPELAQSKMIEITKAVKNECPVGKAFGVSGPGEGVVWKCITPGWEECRTWFITDGKNTV